VRTDLPQNERRLSARYRLLRAKHRDGAEGTRNVSDHELPLALRDGVTIEPCVLGYRAAELFVDLLFVLPIGRR
jgi:hypothetical protein